MNYIRHLNKAFEKMCEDERLTPFHVSLYFSLFQYWNMARFRSPISISRHELMRASKIGSVNTYIRCIKQLDAWAYIKYKPSYNPQIGSLVYLYTFSTSDDNSKKASADNADSNTLDNASEMPLLPSINTTNNSNNKNNIKEEASPQKNNQKNFNQENKKEKLREKKNIRPVLEEIQAFFSNKQQPVQEAEKFFNYFESNGWLVGGKTPMKNWQAAANNWMLNSSKFNNKSETKTSHLHATTGKNYNEAL
jgi:hypothetical protein